MPLALSTSLPPVSSSQSDRTSKESKLPTFARADASGNPLSTNATPLSEAEQPRIPTVRLELDLISDTIASRIATSFLTHVLYLKSQVPMPVPQINRLPSSNPRALKHREEFMESLDLLLSHLDTTFTALSTAFARSASASSNTYRSAYLAFFIGPSISSPKSKVFFAVDGLEEKIWGTRDDEDEDNYIEDVPLSDEEDAEEEEEESLNGDADNDEDPRSTFVRSPTPSPCPPSPNYLRTQSTLQTADRLLSRTLAGNNSLSAELAPTHIHVLLQAPRRFSHPAWIPRQNLSTMMERDLREFTTNSHPPQLAAQVDDKKGKRATPGTKKRAVQVEGIRLAARFAIPPTADSVSYGESENEEDELIWWSWNGKLAGFNDW